MDTYRKNLAYALATLTVAVAASGSAAQGPKKHIIAILADDYGWADAGWHRPPGYKEVQTPNMNALVQGGIEMDRHYVFKFCSPTRSAAQTGRNPIHVNTMNLDPLNYNPRDPVSGMSAVPRNMTGIAEVMKRGGYKTAFFGKWDCGMATMRHTPRGRGYDIALNYFHHMEDYWQSFFENPNGNSNFFPQCQKLYGNNLIHDLWLANASYEGPASTRFINLDPNCLATTLDLCGGNGSLCAPYPGFPGAQHAGCTYVDETFTNEILKLLQEYDVDSSQEQQPLFLFWAPHVIHSPLEVPAEFYNKFTFIPDWRRRRYHAMVNLLDTKIGDVVDALKAQGMYEDSVIFFSSDNGGAIYQDGSAGANNYPLKGGKASNFEGGVRVNAWVGGGGLPEDRRGIKLDGLSTIWDWLATFAAIGGIADITDHAAAEAGLPPVDSLNLWPYISGNVSASPRTAVILGDNNGMVQGVVQQTDKGLFKVLEGALTANGWTGPQCPNRTFATPGATNCKPFCMYKLDTDPYEYNDLVNSTTYADVATQLQAAMATAEATGFHPNRGAQDAQSCLTAMGKYGGFWGPWVDV